MISSDVGGSGGIRLVATLVVAGGENDGEDDEV
jgi:hypothetical protein